MARTACFLVLLAAVAACCLQHAVALSSRDIPPTIVDASQDDVHLHFQQWTKLHNKPYVRDSEEYDSRLAVWLDNLRFVAEHNAGNHSYWLEMNGYADMTVDEYRSHMLGLNVAAANAVYRHRRDGFMYDDVDVAALPKTKDWRDEDAVTDVKNQQACGSCWAFSTTGAVEGANAIFSGKLDSLSEQELVDCDTMSDNGCNGGLMDNAFEFIIDNGGLDTERDYPYDATQGQCAVEKRDRHVVTIDAFQDVPANNEMALLKAAAHQPVSVAIHATERSFQLYGGGVYSDAACGTALNHGVLLVGYGTDKSVEEGGDYWIVKNSWGPAWGERGYVRMQRGIGGPGLCGIAMMASYPIKENPNPPRPPRPTPGPTPPPGPHPGPVKCDDTYECPKDTTCCCLQEYFGICFSWACCPMPKATCCEDHQHCCPHELPVCDTAAGRCLPSGTAVGTDSIAWAPLQKKFPARQIVS